MPDGHATRAHLTETLYWVSIAGLVVSFVILPTIVAALREDYSLAANYISELGAKGAPYALFINMAAFLPTALFSACALFCLAARPALNSIAKLGILLWILGLPLGYFSAFLFPCDPGCPVDGSPRQTMHNVAALVTYGTGILGLLLLAGGLRAGGLGRPARRTFGVACLVTICFAMMLLPENTAMRGYWQRFGDCAMFVLLLSLGILTPKRPQA